MQGLPKPVDILCRQEHKICSPNIAWLNGIWLAAEFICTLAHDGVHVSQNQAIPAGKGGMFLAIGPSMRNYISTRGITNSSRAVWIHIEHPQLGNFGVVAVYAPNNHRQREALWNELSSTLDKRKPWVIARDFNMVEAQGDRKGGTGKILRGVEKRTWNCFRKDLIFMIPMYSNRIF